MTPFHAIASLQVELFRQTLFLSMAMAGLVIRDQQRLMRGWSVAPFPGAGEGGACVPFRLR